MRAAALRRRCLLGTHPSGEQMGNGETAKLFRHGGSQAVVLLGNGSALAGLVLFLTWPTCGWSRLTGLSAVNDRLQAWSVTGH
jgi:hypothetical protein